MINYTHFFLAVLSVFALVNQNINAQDAEVSKLEKFYYDKCLRNAGNTETFTKLRTDVYEMYKYFQYTFDFLPKNRKTFCANERSNLEYRIEEIARDLKPCLPQEEKFFAGFIKESFKEFLHFFCHNDGEFTRRFFNNEGTQCRKKIEESKSNDLENCLNRIFSPTKNYITQKEMCDDLGVARKCFSQLLEVNCQTSYDFKKLNDVFFNYVSKPCSSCVHLVSSFVLLGGLLVHYFMNK